MIFDFKRTCKTYNKDIYNKPYFADARCPKCRAIGRFNMHGSYIRYAVYFDAFELVHNMMDIKRVKCCSCKSTHAVMPGDLVPYRMLSLYVVVFILASYYLMKTPALKIACVWGFSFQFIYTVFRAYRMHLCRIHQYFREAAPNATPLAPGKASTIALIKRPGLEFQHGYTKSNKRPCFMCKFFYRGGAPPIGLLACPPAPRGAAT
jgi:hypothetical protein